MNMEDYKDLLIRTFFEEYEVIYLITAFTKDDQSNLTKEEKNVLKKLVQALKKEAAKNRGKIS